MTIRADASRLTSRIRDIIEATQLAPYALSSVATETISEVKESALTTIAGREDQVGFDIGRFLENISDPSPLEVSGARGTVSILDTEKMGTEADFEEIAGTPSLWHMGRRGGEAFRIAVFDDPGIREELALRRQSVWGQSTPQWYLLENGTLGVPGAYPQAPPAHFIASVTRGDRMALKLRNAMTSLYRGLPRS